MDLKELIPLITCPLTQKVFRDPVIAEDGYTYERKAIGIWYTSHHGTSPRTGYKMKDKLTPNQELAQVIGYLAKVNPEIQRYDPEQVAQSQPNLAEWITWIREDQVEQVIKCIQKNGEPNLTLEIEGEKILLLNYLLQQGKEKMVHELLSSKLIQIYLDPQHEHYHWPHLLSEKYQGDLITQTNLLKEFKKRKLIQAKDLPNMYSFMTSEIHMSFLGLFKSMLKRAPWVIPSLMKNQTHRKQLLLELLEKNIYHPNYYFSSGGWQNSKKNMYLLEAVASDPTLVKMVIDRGAKNWNFIHFFPHPESLKMVLDIDSTKITPETPKNSWSNPPWFVACEFYPQLVPILIQYPINLNYHNHSGNALHLLMKSKAPWEQIRPLIQQLVDLGVDPQAVDRGEESILHLAASRPWEVYEFVRGFFPNPLGISRAGWNMLHFAVKYHNNTPPDPTDTLQKFQTLVAEGVDPSRGNAQKETPLHWLLLNLPYEVCKVLLPLCPEVNAVSYLGPPLDYILRRSDQPHKLQQVQDLIEAGADPAVLCRSGKNVLETYQEWHQNQVTHYDLPDPEYADLVTLLRETIEQLHPPVVAPAVVPTIAPGA